MTATHAAPFGFPHAQLAVLRHVFRWLLRGALALAIILLAGMLAVATAFAGLALARGAILLRLFARHQAGQTPPDVPSSAQGLTLNAKRTPRGWTVE